MHALFVCGNVKSCHTDHSKRSHNKHSRLFNIVYYATMREVLVLYLHSLTLTELILFPSVHSGMKQLSIADISCNSETYFNSSAYITTLTHGVNHLFS